ncbi:MAG: NTP transferase domain-containing protein [Myxococcales bacterium]|nr:NTP transferase domain-containing protein [Myxococcales bacterium]
MKRAIILAAGKGTRLVNGFDFPKPLKRVAGVPLIVRVLRSLEAEGVDEVGIVVGYLADTLIAGVRRYDFDLDITFVRNDAYDKPNGTSLLTAAHLVEGPTLLMMSDHLWSPGVVRAALRFPLPPDAAVLSVDRDVPRCFDLDDATKVRLDGDRIAAIGKELTEYDALDTGVFRITPALIDALREADGPAGCSLSAGVGALAARGKMFVADVGDSLWIDVDTPEAHAAAEKLIARYGDRLVRPAARPVVRPAAVAV